MAGQLEAGRSEALMDHLAAMGRLRHHSWRNVLLIGAQRPNATDVATIHAWHDRGRSVREGEKGVLIFAADIKSGMPRRHKLGDEPLRTGRAGLHAVYGFDVSQTDGKSLPYFEQLATRAPEAGQVERLVALQSIGEQYRPAVSYVVARGLGLETPDGSFDVSRGFRGGAKSLAESLTRVHETSAQILDELLPEPRRGGRAGSDQGRVLLDADAFERLHNEYRVRVVESISGIVRDHDRAEDIAARAFALGWQHRESFRGESAPYTWIQAIARRQVWQSERNSQDMQIDSLDRPDARDIASAELVTDAVENQDARHRLYATLELLPAMYRRVLVAHFLDEHSVREIARRERIPVGTALSRIHTGKQLLREAWAQLPAPSPALGPVVEREFASERKQTRQAPQQQSVLKTIPLEQESWDR